MSQRRPISRQIGVVKNQPIMTLTNALLLGLQVQLFIVIVIIIKIWHGQK